MTMTEGERDGGAGFACLSFLLRRIGLLPRAEVLREGVFPLRLRFDGPACGVPACIGTACWRV